MFSKTFINRPITSIVISLFIIIVGIISIFMLPVAQLPEVTPPVVSVSGMYTGANASDVEKAVTTPVENSVNGATDMLYMNSTSANDGSFSLNVTFKLGSDVNVDAMEVQNRVNLATPILPAEIRQTGLSVKKASTAMLEIVGLYSPHGTHDEKFLSNYAAMYVQNALSRVPGVGDVHVFGNSFAMRVWLNPQKMANLHLTTQDVINAVKEQNTLIPAGSVGAAPAPKGQTFQVSVQIKGRLVSAEEFGNIVVGTNPATGSVIRLKDIARVELGASDYSGTPRLNGKVGCGLAVYQTPGGNALETADLVKAKMEELSKNFPADLAWTTMVDNTRFVKASIDEVVKTLFEVLLLVIFVVFFFLQTWRPTLIAMLAVPVSIIGTFAIFTLIGFTINTLTLFAMVLAIGIVVDDAIVVVEAVQHNIDRYGLSAKEAAIRAMSEVGGPVIAIALILTAVFIPVTFMPGITGMLYKQFAFTIAISVLLSAFVALTLTPALCSIMLRPNPVNKNSKGLNQLFYRFNIWFDKTVENYGESVRKTIKHAPLMFLLLALIYIGTGLFSKYTSTSFLPDEDQGMVMAVAQLPPDASTQRTIEVLNEFGQILNKNKNVEHYFLAPGFSILQGARMSNFGTAFIGLTDWSKRNGKNGSIQAIIGQLMAASSHIKGAKFMVIAPPPIRGLGRTTGFSFILKQSTGTIQDLEKVQNRFLAALNKRPEIQMAYSTATFNYPDIHITIDRVKAKRMGVSMTTLDNTIQTFLGGYYINDFTLFNRTFRVYAQADSSYRASINDLSKYYVRNDQGNMVPVSELLNITRSTSAPVITHYNMDRNVNISGNAAPGYSSGDAIKALRQVAQQVLPEGYSYEFSGTTLQEIEGGKTSTFIFILAIVFVFLFLSALYESFAVPFAVLLAVPIGIFGAYLSLHIGGLSSSIYAQIGIITLIGLAAKNAILIVEYCKMKYESGVPLVQAAVEAAKLRIRPILMTSLAFDLGVIPLMLATGAGANARINIGYTVFGGMLTATLLAIFFIPLFYVTIIKIRDRKKKPDMVKTDI
ncbi:MAG: multidrug efflux RND transporter permease subunit [Bacteroidales bacterium]|nr:multidrug efflux RND transporter permease subunit [Bacteroidales bacterium]